MSSKVTTLHETIGVAIDAADQDHAVQSVRERVRAEMARHGLTIQGASREAGVSQTTLSKWLRDAYEGDDRATARKLDRWLHTRAEAEGHALAAAGLDDFAGTAAAAEIEAALARAQATGDIALVHGPSGRGKTVAARRYARDHSGCSWIAMTAAVTTLSGMLARVCEAVGEGSDHPSALAAERSLVRHLTGRNALLIVDEAHHLPARLLDELRSIRDEAGCGLALIGDESLRMVLARCPQILGRVGGRVDLRNLSASDVAAIARGPLGRAATKAEARALAEATHGRGGLHTLRRVLTAAIEIRRAEGRDRIDQEMLADALETVADQERERGSGVSD